MMLAAILLCLGVLNASALPVQKNVQVKGDATYFLPDNLIIPTKYKITIDVSKSFTNLEDRIFTGSVEIDAAATKLTNQIILHAAQIKILDTTIIEVKNVKNNDIYEKYEFDEKRQFLILSLKEEITVGTLRIVIKDYSGTLQDDMHGFYVSQYKQNGDKDVMTVLTTQFQPTHARKAFPCFDEPKYKAKFELTFIKEGKYKVISNMPSIEKEHGSGVTEVHFPETPAMSTYLVAFIVHEFENRPSPDHTNYNVWARPEAINQTNWATDYVYKIVDDLNKFTGINYEKEHISKMDMAALPDFSAGAMENWGLLTYRETALLVDKELSTNKDIQRVVSVISHEVAHQWFGNLVTLEWWMNTWLNEGFARYFEYHTTGNVLPEWEMREQFVVEQQQKVFDIDALAESTPLTLSVYTPSEISAHFGSISYAKGGSVIRMMEHFLGNDTFKEGLQHYLDQNRFGNTVPQNLWTALQEIIDTKDNFILEYPIKTVMTNWISQAGYPVIDVKYEKSGHVTFSQKRFYINPDENTAKKQDTRWFVPISYTTSKDLDFKNLKPKFWLTPHEPVRTVAVGNNTDYVVANIQEAGYYRVNYDEALWQRLSHELSEEAGKKIHPINKAQIVDDVMNLARAGLVNYSIAFNVTDYLATETDYYPWYSAFQAFRFLLQRYSDTEDTGKELRSYLRNLTELVVKDKEFVDKKESQIQVFNRVASLEWACNLGHEKCIDQAKDMYKGFRTKDAKIPKNLRSIVYCTALRNGDKADWDFLWNKFVKSNSAAEKVGIINALGCSNDAKILDAFLLKSIDPSSGIRKQDALYVFTAVYTGNTIGVDRAFNFLKNHHEEMKTKYNGLNDLEKGVLGLGTRLTDKKKIDEFKKLLKSSKNFENFRDAAIETLDENIAWSENYRDIIGKILIKKRTGTAAAILANKFVLLISLGFVSIYSMFH